MRNVGRQEVEEGVKLGKILEAKLSVKLRKDSWCWLPFWRGRSFSTYGGAPSLSIRQNPCHACLPDLIHVPDPCH